MQLDRFTIKSQEAIQQAIRLAADRRNSETAPEHLLLALLDQAEGIVGPVLRKVGADPGALRSEIGGALDRLPTITAGAREPGLIEYLIERVTVIRPEDITEELRDVDWFKPGYTLVEIRRRHCPADAACGSEAWDDLQVYLRPRGDAWEVVSWRSEAEPEGAPEIPDAFRPQGPRQ